MKPNLLKTTWGNLTLFGAGEAQCVHIRLGRSQWTGFQPARALSTSSSLSLGLAQAYSVRCELLCLRLEAVTKPCSARPQRALFGLTRGWRKDRHTQEAAH